MKSFAKIALAIAALASIALAVDKPNFSGDWKMNAAKSNFGAIPAPATYTRKVTHAEPSITIEIPRLAPNWAISTILAPTPLTAKRSPIRPMAPT